jgi:HEPN domain-containing protein
MAEEYEAWMEKSEEDLDAAKYLLEGKMLGHSAFFCQQTIEKALKALLIKEKEVLIKTYSVRKLSKLLDLPKDFQDSIVKLEDVERLARYPMTNQEIENKYNDESVEEFLKIAEEVLVWIKDKIE